MFLEERLKEELLDAVEESDDFALRLIAVIFGIALSGFLGHLLVDEGPHVFRQFTVDKNDIVDVIEFLERIVDLHGRHRRGGTSRAPTVE